MWLFTFARQRLKLSNDSKIRFLVKYRGEVWIFIFHGSIKQPSFLICTMKYVKNGKPHLSFTSSPAYDHQTFQPFEESNIGEYCLSGKELSEK